MKNERLFVGAAEAARILGLGKTSIWALIANGSLRVVRVGGKDRAGRTLIIRQSIQELADKLIEGGAVDIRYRARAKCRAVAQPSVQGRAGVDEDFDA